jgi:hypothetical protein
MANMDTNPGWSATGQWQWGVPTGGGTHCYDPTSGHTGAYVYGYNLAGDYPNLMSMELLTTTAINCSNYKNIKLKFWRWLGIESSSFDHAKIEVSNDGNTWTTIWNHTGGPLCDGTWTQYTYDISAVANDQPTVYIRWAMGPTDYSITYPGWNIDDMEITGDHRPVAQTGSASTQINTLVLITLVATDDGLPNPPGALTYIITSLPSHGELSDPCAGDINSVPYTLAGNGNQVIYTPDVSFTGSDSFQFKANDNDGAEGGDSNIAAVSIIESSIQVTPGDFEPDGDVDWDDLAVLVDQWLQPPGTPSADIAPLPAGDDTVNFLDFAEFAMHWLEGI